MRLGSLILLASIAPIVAQGACSAADNTLWQAGANASFTEDFWDCFVQEGAFASVQAFSDCITNNFHAFSAPCSTCYGEGYDCAKADCTNQCGFGTKEECIGCALFECAVGFNECSGLDPPLGEDNEEVTVFPYIQVIIAGIVVGVLLILTIVACLLYKYWWKPRKKRLAAGASSV